MIDLSPQSRFGMALCGVARRWRRWLDDGLAAAGHDDASWLPLTHLAGAEAPICQRDLAHRAGLDESTLVRLIDRLVARGHVEKRPSATDRRSNLLTITPAGRTAASEVFAVLERIEADLLGPTTEAERAAALDLLERIDGRITASRRAGKP